MDRFEDLKQKYSSVLATAKREGISLAHLNLQGNSLFLQGTAPSEASKNALWNQIKSVNPVYDDIVADITVDTSLPQPTQAGSRQTYTVKPGDSLSIIAKQFYGSATEYMRIFNANKDKLKDPNQIQVGQELLIPGR